MPSSFWEFSWSISHAPWQLVGAPEAAASHSTVPRLTRLLHTPLPELCTCLQVPSEVPVTHCVPCSTCSPGRYLLYCCHSPPLPSMMPCLLNLQSPSFSSVFHSSQRGPTRELLGLQEFTRSDFSLCRILLRAGLRRCHHLYPESAFSFSYLTLVLSYLTHGIRDLFILFFIISSWIFPPLKLSSILPPSFPISPIIPRPQPWRFCSFSKRGRLL